MTTEVLIGHDAYEANYRKARVAHWDTIARKMDVWTGRGGYYHRRLTQVYRFLVAPGQRVIEIGCSKGDLLAGLRPAFGVGVDFSGEMLKRAASRHPELHFIQADAHDLSVNETFDIIILSDLVNELCDVQTVFEKMAGLATRCTRVILNTYSRVWELPLAVVKRLGLGKPTLDQNWLTVEDIKGLLNLAEFEVIRHWEEILWPLQTPVLGTFFNHFVVRFFPFKTLALTNFIVARPWPQRSPPSEEPLVSVIIPARNEAGNIPQIFSRVPQMGGGTELVFVEGHSKDETYTGIERAMADHPDSQSTLFRQAGMGKGDAVRLGFAQAKGEILMILDADLTVPPEDLPRFYEALRSGKGEFINGVRLVYPLEKQAMRFLNLAGNKLFGLAFSWLLGQPVRDTLCGTKALWKDDYERIADNRTYFGDFDPFGDFDLLFGADKLNLKIVEVPIRYRRRTYGKTNIQRWKHGWLLVKMVVFASRRIKFV
jgi:SAM-dependent methyltransferase